MFAIIQDSGQQFKVQQGDTILIDHKRFSQGDEILFERVLFVDGRIGSPYVEGAKVTGVVKCHELAKKIYVQKFKRRKKYRRRTGHRQRYLRIEIKSIDA